VKKMIDDAADATVANADRATNLVNAILDQYYSGQRAMVSSVVYSAAEPGLLTTAATSPTAKGKITVGDAFLNGMTERFASRRILQVGHELQHIGQQRQGLGGPAGKDLREFFAHARAALQPDPTGTRPIPNATRVAMCDASLGHYYCMPAAKQTEYEARRDEVLAKRAIHDGQGGTPHQSTDHLPAGVTPNTPPATVRRRRERRGRDLRATDPSGHGWHARPTLSAPVRGGSAGSQVGRTTDSQRRRRSQRTTLLKRRFGECANR
jgi:hypothetical protein